MSDPEDVYPKPAPDATGHAPDDPARLAATEDDGPLRHRLAGREPAGGGVPKSTGGGNSSLGEVLVVGHVPSTLTAVVDGVLSP